MLEYAKLKKAPEGVTIAYGLVTSHSGVIQVEHWHLDGSVKTSPMQLNENDFEFHPANDDTLEAFTKEHEDALK